MKKDQKGTGIHKRVFINQPYFKHLAKVLGNKRALREVRKVARSSPRVLAKLDFPRPCDGASSLGSAFVWKKTPQGLTFWKNLDSVIESLVRNEEVSY